MVNINPWFINGIWDGDGNFNLKIVRNSLTLLKWTASCSCSLVASRNAANILMLTQINNYFNNIYFYYFLNIIKSNFILKKIINFIK